MVGACVTLLPERWPVLVVNVIEGCNDDIAMLKLIHLFFLYNISNLFPVSYSPDGLLI